MMMQNPHLVAFYVLLTINSAADALIFEDWSLLLISSLALRLVAITTTILLRFSTSPVSWPLLGSTSFHHGREGKNNNKRPSLPQKLCLLVLYVMPLLLNNIYWLNKMPFTWESDLWSVQVDFVVILYYVVIIIFTIG